MICPRCGAANPEESRFCANCAAPLSGDTAAGSRSRTQTLSDSLPDLSRGGLFAGRYEIIEELGSGGMGRVYKAYDRKLKEKIALKLIHPDLGLRPRTLERFRDEIRLARRITHRNVCRMHDLGEERGTPFITMEYVPGEDLKSIIRMVDRLSPAQAIAIARQVAAGLAEAHRLGIIHRDLKPRNIMIDREGTAKIMDFGLARSVDEKGLTDGQAMIGTPDYMSPEQAEGLPADEQSDIYALGVVLFEMLTGRLPFESGTPLGVAVKHKTERPPDPRKLNPLLPEALSRVVLKCLEKDKSRRYPSAAALLAGLDELARQFPGGEKLVPRTRPSDGAPVPGRPRSKALKAAAGALLGLAVLALAVRFLLLPGKPPPPAAGGLSLAVLYFENETGDKDLDFLREASVDYLIPELRGAAPGITILSEDAMKSVLSRLGLEDARRYSRENLKAVAARTRASHLLTAVYSLAGSDLEIKYRLTEARGERTVGSGSVRGGLDEYGPLAARLGRLVLSDLELPARESDRPLPSVALPALRFYQLARQSERKYRRSGDSRDFDEARGFYEQAIHEEPRYALALVGLGDLYQRSYVIGHNRPDLDRTLEYYERAYGIAPESPETNAGLGWAYFFKGYNDGAFSFFKRAHELAPDNPSIAANIGSFFLSIGLPGEAVKFYTQAIDRGGLYSAVSGGPAGDVHRLRATARERLGEADLAVADARVWLELEPDTAEAALFLARLLIGRKDLPEAEREIAVVERVDPAARSLRFTRALLFAARGDRDRALPLLAEAREDPLFYSYLLSRVYAACGLKDEALQVIGQGIERGFESQGSYLYEYPLLERSWFYDSLREDPRFRELLARRKAAYEENLKKYGGL